MKNYYRTKSNVAGFTVLEIAIVVLIVGLLMSAALPLLKTYRNWQTFAKTQESMRLTQAALRDFYGLKGRYPCPADPSLPVTSEDYGLELCRNDPFNDPCPPGLTCPPVATSGSRDANGDGTPDPVLIGAIPSRTLIEGTSRFAKFRIANAQDAHLMKFTYAVSELMTRSFHTISNPANPQLGAIALKDEFGRDVLTPADSAHYVFLSHGDNNLGAFSIEGANMGGCTVLSVGGLPTEVPIGNNITTTGIEVEKENCDRNDAIFVKGLRSTANNDRYFDDTLFFNATVASNLWRPSNFSPSGETYLYNTNFGNVGVGVSDPSEKLHVDGDVRTETQVLSDDGYCDSAETADCLLPEALGGTAMTPCPAGRIATGIENNNLVCVPLFSGPIDFTCPNPGEFVRSFSNLGTITCAVP